MDPGDLIYFVLIVFGIVVSIISNVNKAKKKKQAQTQPVETYEAQEPEYLEDEQEIDIRSVFEEIIGQAQPKPVPSAPAQPVSVEQLEVEPFSRDSIEDLSMEDLRKQHIKEDDSGAYSHSIPDQVHHIDFDLRQAIIYNVILDRPYS